MTKQQKHYTDEELGYPTEAYGRIPSFRNRDEEAAFWDTHDLTEIYGEELHPVEATVNPEFRSRAANRVTVQLEPAEREALAKRAEEHGTDPATLAHDWLKERLLQEAQAEATAR